MLAGSLESYTLSVNRISGVMVHQVLKRFLESETKCLRDFSSLTLLHVNCFKNFSILRSIAFRVSRILHQVFKESFEYYTECLPDFSNLTSSVYEWCFRINVRLFKSIKSSTILFFHHSFLPREVLNLQEIGPIIRALDGVKYR